MGKENHRTKALIETFEGCMIELEAIVIKVIVERQWADMQAVGENAPAKKPT